MWSLEDSSVEHCASNSDPALEQWDDGMSVSTVFSAFDRIDSPASKPTGSVMIDVWAVG